MLFSLEFQAHRGESFPLAPSEPVLPEWYFLFPSRQFRLVRIQERISFLSMGSALLITGSVPCSAKARGRGPWSMWRDLAALHQEHGSPFKRCACLQFLLYPSQLHHQPTTLGHTISTRILARLHPRASNTVQHLHAMSNIGLLLKPYWATLMVSVPSTFLSRFPHYLVCRDIRGPR